eukprot:Clim_evm10s24 gene=Clim_evmTU10s24
MGFLWKSRRRPTSSSVAQEKTEEHTQTTMSFRRQHRRSIADISDLTQTYTENQAVERIPFSRQDALTHRSAGPRQKFRPAFVPMTYTTVPQVFCHRVHNLCNPRYVTNSSCLLHDSRVMFRDLEKQSTGDTCGAEVRKCALMLWSKVLADMSLKIAADRAPTSTEMALTSELVKSNLLRHSSIGFERCTYMLKTLDVCMGLLSLNEAETSLPALEILACLYLGSPGISKAMLAALMPRPNSPSRANVNADKYVNQLRTITNECVITTKCAVKNLREQHQLNIRMPQDNTTVDQAEGAYEEDLEQNHSLISCMAYICEHDLQDALITRILDEGRRQHSFELGDGKTAVDWSAIPGYASLLLIAFQRAMSPIARTKSTAFNATAKRTLCRTSPQCVECLTVVCSNPVVLEALCEVFFKQVNPHSLEDVLSLTDFISSIVNSLSAARMVSTTPIIPGNGDGPVMKALVRGIKALLTGEHFQILETVLRFIRSAWTVFNGLTRKAIIELIMTQSIFEKFFLHWHNNVRDEFYETLVNCFFSLDDVNTPRGISVSEQRKHNAWLAALLRDRVRKVGDRDATAPEAHVDTRSGCVMVEQGLQRLQTLGRYRIPNNDMPGLGSSVDF